MAWGFQQMGSDTWRGGFVPLSNSRRRDCYKQCDGLEPGGKLHIVFWHARRRVRRQDAFPAPQGGGVGGLAGFPHPWEAPAIGFRVGGVAELATGTSANDHLLNVAAKVCKEVVSEAAHEISVALDRLPALQRSGCLISKEGHVLPIALAGFPPLPGPVHEKQIRVIVPGLQNPLWQRYLQRAP